MSVDAARALNRFCEFRKATLELSGGDAAFDWITALQRRGGFLTTFAEVGTRCDLAIFLGDDRLFELYPRLPEALWPEGMPPANILLLGRFTEPASAELQRRIAGDGSHSVIRIEADASECYRLLRRSASGSETADGDAAFATLQAGFAGSQSRAIIVAPEVCESLSSQLFAAALELSLNQSADRVTAVLPLGGAATTLQQTAAWNIGYPGRVHFEDPAVIYDPRCLRRFDSTPAPSVELYVSELNCPVETPSQTAIGTTHRIFIGCRPRDPRPEDIQIATPRIGIEAAGALFRSDAAVALHCPAERTSTAITAAAILHQLADRGE